MEGKVVIVSVVLVFVVFGQIQVAAAKTCCPSAGAKNGYTVCRLGQPKLYCQKMFGCKVVDGKTCPGGWMPVDILENAAAHEYCKLGCVSSVCGAITTLQNSDASEVVNGAVEKCTDACSSFCTNKASIAAVVETAA